MDDPEAALGSPIFDVPELPALRRVKPLPKRRRTSAPDDATASSAIDPRQPAQLSALLPPTPGPDAPAEELIAHAEALTAQMALQSYYMPILSGVHDLMGGGAPDDDGDGDDGDYFDHQLGNTKKRKVPANPQLGSGGEAHLAGEDDDGAGADRAIPVGGGRNNDDYDGGGAAERPSSPAGWTPQRRGRMLPATIVGLQHKDMLRYRKRQLAAVLGALSHGDTLALDQALSAHYPLLARRSHVNNADVRHRKRRRVRPTRVRATTTAANRSVALPEAAFTFVCHSATSDRLVATREEVAVLHARIEAELARQAARAEEAAKQAEAAVALASTKRTDRKARKARTGTSGTTNGNNSPLTIAPPPAAKRGKKKKRSALANASNPHHLRNYVPSRLPNQGQGNASQTNSGAQNLLTPLPLRFLSAQVPSRKSSSLSAVAQLVNPADEWICPTCEYRLFYGDDAAYRLAVRNRKKILKRRQRARERAAAAASGKKGAAMREGDMGDEDDDTDSGFEGEVEGVVPAAGGRQQTGRVDKDGDRGGHGGTGG
ncbi:hypothetical protein OF83DRAFT_1098617 [Amylostereum chailletii]|nr:hypothetical protein OF83DRAFT_1098617 [Amylostereum chailletii]